MFTLFSLYEKLIKVYSSVAGFIGESPVLLAKPQTYMNLSGESVRLQEISCLNFYIKLRLFIKFGIDFVL